MIGFVQGAESNARVNDRAPRQDDSRDAGFRTMFQWQLKIVISFMCFGKHLTFLVSDFLFCCQVMSEENNSLRRRGEGADLEPRLVREVIIFCYQGLGTKVSQDIITIFCDTVSMGKV